MGCYIKVLKQYAVFAGRASRKEYLMFVLINSIIFWLLIPFMEGALRNLLGGAQRPTYPMLINIIYGLAIMIPSISVGVRRLHDTNRRGWWVLPGLIPVALLAYPLISEPVGWYMLLGLVPFAGFNYLPFFYLQGSQPGENQYGPNPKDTFA